MRQILGLCLLPAALFAGDANRQQPQLTTSEHFDFAPGGTIKVGGSFGCLSIEGWDRSEVEVTAIRQMTDFYTGKKQERANARLKNVQIHAERRSPTELDISTSLPKHSHWFTVPLSSATRNGIDMEYEIRVPRHSHLVIHHGDGSVIIADVSGEIEASSRSGDVMVLLPKPGPYSINAKTLVGTIYNDFGNASSSHAVGERFNVKEAAGTRVYLRTGYGGISIQEITSGGY